MNSCVSNGKEEELRRRVSDENTDNDCNVACQDSDMIGRLVLLSNIRGVIRKMYEEYDLSSGRITTLPIVTLMIEASCANPKVPLFPGPITSHNCKKKKKKDRIAYET